MNAAEVATKLRLLRLLSRPQVAGLQNAENGTSVTFQDRTHRFPADIVRQCIADGSCARHEQRLLITDAGVSWLKRQLHPEASFVAQHGPVSSAAVREGDSNAPALVNLGESPLMRLYVRRDAKGASWIDQAQFAAGERLRADFERGRLSPRISLTLDRTPGGGMPGAAASLSDFAQDCRRRVEAALDLLGNDLAGVALDVCCFLKGLEAVERERQWPPRSAKLMLRTALSALARHYGLDNRAKGGRRALVQWGQDDYRPGL